MLHHSTDVINEAEVTRREAKRHFNAFPSLSADRNHHSLRTKSLYWGTTDNLEQGEIQMRRCVSGQSSSLALTARLSTVSTSSPLPEKMRSMLGHRASIAKCE
jgi:hypothetical protein